MNSFLIPHLERLKTFTADCQDNMHEPDEQGIDAVFGPQYHSYQFSNGPSNPVKVTLDNACTGTPDQNGDMGFWLVNTNTNKSEWFNLATIIALAREAR